MIAEFKLADLPIKRNFPEWRLWLTMQAESLTLQKAAMAKWIGACFVDEATCESVTELNQFMIFDGKLKAECLRICIAAKNDKLHSSLARLVAQRCEDAR